MVAAANPESDDYYEVLGISKDATEAQIKKAYRRNAMKFHPDKNVGDPSAEEKFKKVGEAYEVLSDKEKRQMYDQFGKQGAQQFSQGGGMPSGFGGGGQGFSQQQAQDIFNQFFGTDDPFAALFSGSGGGGSGFGGGGMPGGFGGGGPGVRTFRMGGGGGMPGGFGGGGMPGGFGGGGMPGGFGGGGMPGGFGGFGMPQQQQHGGFPGGASSRSPPDVISEGTKVMIKGLRSKPAYNGEFAQILGFDPSKSRYHVVVESSEGETLSLKRENLQQIVQGVEIRGLESKPELNGQQGTLFDRDPVSDRYEVRLPRYGRVSVKPQNVVLPKGTNVVVVGLKSSGRFNGRAGTVVDVDRVKSRFVVQLPSNEHIRIKYENTRV